MSHIQLSSLSPPLIVCQDRTLSSLPVQASGRHYSAMIALDSSEALGPLPSWLPRIRGHWLNKDHQLSPDSVQTQLETPVPWDLEAHTGPFILELKYRPNPTISWMRPGSLRLPPICPPVCLGEQVTESPASQPSRGFIQTQLLSHCLIPHKEVQEKYTLFLPEHSGFYIYLSTLQ